MTDKKPTVMVSGGFDPVHVGHIRLIQAASQYGDVLIIANSDKWIYKEKGFVFMDFEQRKEILSAFKGVLSVESVDDEDGTVRDAIYRHKPDYFANGGPRHFLNTPEASTCEQLGVKMLWDIGGGRG